MVDLISNQLEKYYKQLTLMEDAMLIHRIMRAPEKRMFYVNVGAIPPNEVEQFMQKTINSIKKTPYVDPQTGDYNLKIQYDEYDGGFLSSSKRRRYFYKN
jgi:hypothetical protein